MLQLPNGPAGDMGGQVTDGQINLIATGHEPNNVVAVHNTGEVTSIGQGVLPEVYPMNSGDPDVHQPSQQGEDEEQPEYAIRLRHHIRI